MKLIQESLFYFRISFILSFVEKRRSKTDVTLVNDGITQRDYESR